MPRLIALLTDFGHHDIYVGVVKSVILSRLPKAVLIDLTHSVPPGDIPGAAFQLRAAAPYLPEDALFLAVVDPGVGGKRRPICARSGGRLLVGPDNGLLRPAASALGEPEFFHLDKPQFWLPRLSSTFHGRDLFAPVAAALAGGTPPEEVGAPITDPVTLVFPSPLIASGGARSARGEVIWIDHYGNAVTNFQPEYLAGALEDASAVTFTVGGVDLGPPRTHYGASASGEALVVLGSFGYYEIAVRDGSAAERLSLARGTPVWVRGAP
jgi:S-adenosyl-L-methionine hydrolase (adenosine-forming)